MQFPSVSLGVATNYASETPSGTINGSNKDFVLSHTPLVNSLAIYLNGVFQVNGTDYTLSSATITFSVAPSTGDSVYAKYNY